MATVLNSSWHLLSFIGAVYFVFMFVYFRTTFNVATLESLFTESFWHHPVDISSEPRNMVCRAGHVAAFGIAAALLARESVRPFLSPKTMAWSSIGGVGAVALIGGWLNRNVGLYTLPWLGVECVAAWCLPSDQSKWVNGAPSM